MFAEDFAGRVLPFDSAAASAYAGVVELRDLLQELSHGVSKPNHCPELRDA